jgi:hypothetical protein
MTGTGKNTYALLEYDGDSTIFPKDHEAFRAGIKEIRVKYAFCASNKMNIYPSVTGAGWKVTYVSAFDISRFFVGSSGLSNDQKRDAVINEITNGTPFWRYEVKNEKPPYMCELGKNFGGIAIMFVVVVAKPKAPYHYASFVFISRNLTPAVTFVMGFGSEFVIARHEGEYRILETFYAIRLPDGSWGRAGKAEESKKKLTTKDLEAIAVLDCLSLFKQMYQAEAKIGKKYLDDIFDNMEKEGKVVACRIMNPLALAGLVHIYKIAQFLLPSPYQNWTEASRQFEIVLNPKATFAEKVGGFFGFIGYGAFVILDFVPGSKALKKADDFVKGLRGVKKLEKVEEVVQHTEKIIKEAEKNLEEVAQHMEDMKRANQMVTPAMEEGLQRIQRAKAEGERLRKTLSEGFTQLGADEQIRLWEKAQKEKDVRELLLFASRSSNPMTLKQVCAATKGWGAKRRWKAFVEWMKLQRMSGKQAEKIRFSDEVQKLADEGEKFTDKSFFNLGHDGFKAIVARIRKGMKKVAAKGLSRKEIDQFKESLKEAYKRLRESKMMKERPELMEHIGGMEASGKSGAAFHDSSITYLDDIDCTIWPIDLPTDPIKRADALMAKKQFYEHLEQVFKEKTGQTLKEKNIFVYPEFGGGAFNKKTEGYPPKLRSIYEHVEQKGGVRFTPNGELSEVRIRNAETAYPKPTKEEVQAFREWALKEFKKTKKPKWILKVDRANQFVGVAYSAADNEIIRKMGTVYVRDIGKILPSEQVLVSEAMEFLKKYAADPDAAVSPLRYIFLFKNSYEAKQAYEYVKSFQFAERSIRILYVDSVPETKKKPPMKTIRLITEKTAKK